MMMAGSTTALLHHREDLLEFPGKPSRSSKDFLDGMGGQCLSMSGGMSLFKGVATTHTVAQIKSTSAIDASTAAAADDDDAADPQIEPPAIDESADPQIESPAIDEATDAQIKSTSAIDASTAAAAADDDDAADPQIQPPAIDEAADPQIESPAIDEATDAQIESPAAIVATSREAPAAGVEYKTVKLGPGGGDTDAAFLKQALAGHTAAVFVKVVGEAMVNPFLKPSPLFLWAQPYLHAGLALGSLLFGGGVLLLGKRRGFSRFMIKFGSVVMTVTMLAPVALGLPPGEAAAFVSVAGLIIAFVAAHY